MKYLIEECNDHKNAGWGTHLYLIPAEENDGEDCVYLFRTVGNGTPIEVYHRRWFSLGCPGLNYHGETLQAQLEQHEDVWRQIAAGYKGAEWDGHNMVGRWDESLTTCEFEEDIEELIEDCASKTPNYWSPEEWFSEGVSIPEVGKFKSVKAWAEYESGFADDALLDPKECEQWLDEYLENQLERLDGEDDAAEIKKILALLD